MLEFPSCHCLLFQKQGVTNRREKRLVKCYSAKNYASNPFITRETVYTGVPFGTILMAFVYLIASNEINPFSAIMLAII